MESCHVIPPDGKASEELVAEGLSLRDGAEAAVDDLLGVELDAILGEVEPLLDDRGQLPDPAALLAEHVLRARGADDDLRAHRRDAHLHAGVAVLRQLPRQHLVELGVEHTVADELRTRAPRSDTQIHRRKGGRRQGSDTVRRSSRTFFFLLIWVAMVDGGRWGARSGGGGGGGERARALGFWKRVGRGVAAREEAAKGRT